MKGEVVYLHAFDVANEIITRNVREILSIAPFPFEIRTESNFPKDLPLYKPMAIEPAPLSAGIKGQPVRLLIRVYDVGVITVAMRVAFNADRLDELSTFHDPKLDNGQDLSAIARDLCTKVCKSLEGLLVRSSAANEPEAYTVFCLSDIGKVADVNAWLADERRAVAGLLAQCQSGRLSEGQIGESLRLQASFESSDLVVVDWDAALSVDLSGYFDDVVYVLELANLQLEEFRLMDRTLDGYLNQAYEDLERHRFVLFGVSSTLLRKLRRFRVDVTKIADEITHITKLFGDWYLARVYLAARERFHLDQWRNSVERRLAQLDQLYSVVHSEINERRMLWLEMIIVILFVIDLAMIFFKK